MRAHDAVLLKHGIINHLYNEKLMTFIILKKIVQTPKEILDIKKIKPSVVKMAWYIILPFFDTQACRTLVKDSA